MQCFFQQACSQREKAGDEEHLSRLPRASITSSQVDSHIQYSTRQYSVASFARIKSKTLVSYPTHINADNMGAPLVYHLSILRLQQCIVFLWLSDYSLSNSLQHFHRFGSKDWYFLLLFPHNIGTSRTVQFKSTWIIAKHLILSNTTSLSLKWRDEELTSGPLSG